MNGHHRLRAAQNSAYRPAAPEGAQLAEGLTFARRAGPDAGVLRAATLGIALLLLPGAASARPFSDVQRAFSLTLLKPWAVSPGFGELRRMSFSAPERVRLSIELLPTGLGLARGVAARLKADGGAFDRAARPLTVAGVEARGALAKLSGRRAGYFGYAAGGRAYVIALYAPAGRWRTSRRQAEALLASFAVHPHEARPAPPPGIVGRWRGEAGQRLELRADGRFSLADHEGSYSLEGDRLRLRLDGGEPRIFRIERPSSKRLRLQLEGEGTRVEYRREEAQPPRLVGRWIATQGPKPRLVLLLKASGRFRFAAASGRWSAERGALSLSAGPTEAMRYRYRFVGAQLELSGGDLDDPLRLARVPR